MQANLQNKLGRDRKIASSDSTTSIDQDNGDLAVGQQRTHATRQIWTRDPKKFNLTMDH